MHATTEKPASHPQPTPPMEAWQSSFFLAGEVNLKAAMESTRHSSRTGSVARRAVGRGQARRGVAIGF